MKKIVNAAAIFAAAVILFGCASTPQSADVPLWVANYRSVYPSSEFIAQRKAKD